MSRTQALNKLMIVIGLLFILLVALHSPAATLHHNLSVEISPTLKMIKGRDTVTFPEGTPRKLTFLLHKGLNVRVVSSDDVLSLINPATGGNFFSEYGVQLGGTDNKLTLDFSGVIYDPVVNDDTQGLISVEGAALFEETYWHPSFLSFQKNFDITIKTPADWRALVQGQLASTGVYKNMRQSRFVNIYPQEEIALIAGAFKTYEVQMNNGPKVQVFLRQADTALAQKFLNLVPDYISYYSQEIAPYPYPEFTVVENFWETGFAFPSFTLLGPSVIRLPFILNSSLPHEVLHNWWGNGVFVDYAKGNWCEGLTTYMGDYWQQNLAGQGASYRLKILMNYDDFVTQNPEKDFPVREFRGRHNASSQAVGYGKTLMIFHMLETRFGKDLFRKALQDFYKENLFKKTSFVELQKSFESVTQQNLESFFVQWLDRKGAPSLEMSDVKVLHWLDGSFSSTFTLKQNPQDVYDLVIPLIWKLESGEELRQIARLTDSEQVFSLVTRSRPVKLSVDPEYNIFRKLYLEERPSTLASVFGSKEVHFYTDEGTLQTKNFVQVWMKSLEGSAHVHPVNGNFQPTAVGSLVLVGDRPEFRRFMAEQLQGQDFEFTEKDFRLGQEMYKWSEHSTVLVARLKNNPQQTVVWVRWSSDNNPEEWAGRLTHYGTFGILLFKGRPVVYKSTWPVLSSPLSRDI